MGNLRLKYSKLVKGILPLAFLSNSYISFILLMVAYPFFNDHEGIRLALTAVIGAVLWCILLADIIINQKRISKKEIIVMIVAVVVTAMPFIVSAVLNGIDGRLILIVGRYGVFVTVYIFIASILNREKNYKEFIAMFKWYGVILLPFMIFYVSRLFRVQTVANEFISIGGMSYAMVATTLLTIVLASMMELATSEEKKYSFINWGILFFYGTTIVYTGTRSVILCVMFAVVLMAVMFLYQASKFTKKRIVSAMVLLLTVTLFSMYVWAPVSSGFGKGGRFDDGGSAILSEASRIGNNELNNIFMKEIVANDDYVVDTVDRVKHEILKEGKYADKLEAGSFTKKEVKEYDFYIGRPNLYISALNEFKKSPLTGNGPLFYENKYGTYSHNWFLEMLCDFGIVITVMVVIFVMIILIMFFRIVKGDSGPKSIVFICLSYLPIHMLSGSFYINSMVVFSIMFVVIYVVQKKYVRENVE